MATPIRGVAKSEADDLGSEGIARLEKGAARLKLEAPS